MTLFQSGQKVTYYDYVGVYSTSSGQSQAYSIGLKTPVTEKDVLIQTKWMPICATANRGTYYLIARRPYLSSGMANLYGAGITPYAYSGSNNRGILAIQTTGSSDIEFGVSAWARDDEWLDTEIKMSLNPVNATNNYIKVSSHQVSLAASSSAVDSGEAWFLFALNGQSAYWNDRSTDSPLGAGLLQRTKFYDFTGTNLLADLLPCVRNNIVGMIDDVSGRFCPIMQNSTPLDTSSSSVRYGNLS